LACYIFDLLASEAPRRTLSIEEAKHIAKFGKTPLICLLSPQGMMKKMSLRSQ
jgi:hypothetical protein